ncbi:MAG: ATP-binding protein [Acidobacteriota bacterium]|nr:ATP-binding protein [Acidobacteriota bacterium]
MLAPHTEKFKTGNSAAEAVEAAARILVISEHADESFFSFLETDNFKIFLAPDAISALNQFDTHSPELVLFESSFSEVSPAGLCELLRAKKGREHLPILVFSSRIEDESEETAFNCEADDFLRISISEKEFLWRVRRQLRVVREQRAAIEENRISSFLYELGRNLLVTLEPEQALTQTAAATYEVTEAAVCAAAALITGNSATVSSFNREGSAEGDSEIYSERLKKWLQTEATESALLVNQRDFLLKDEFHQCEYLAPLIIGERTKGVLVVGFDNLADCTLENRRIIDAAAQLAAMSVHITSLYDAALNASVYFAQEEQKRFTEAILDALPVSLYAIDKDYRVVAWNKHREIGKQGIPREAAIGRNVFDVLPRQPREMLEREFERAFVTGKIERVEQKTSDENGAVKHWLVSKVPMRDSATGEVTHVISVGEDITARVDAQHAVARAEKLAAVGRLAAGVVHEINNPLATIAACAEALEARADEGAFGSGEDADDLRDYLNLIRSEAFRCKNITNGLLDFSRVRTSRQTPADVAEIVRSSTNLIAHQKRGGNVEICVEINPNLPKVSADEGQIQQAIIALATNAIDAMPDGGRLTFRAYARRQRVFLEIEDTGAGIPPENIAKIFEPFFTTKEVGKGTGLGLAVCYGIVTEHGGSLNVRSTVGIGSTFTISLPIKFENSSVK